MGSIGFPKVQQAEDVEYDHEQDAEQDRIQHDRGRKSSMSRTLHRPQRTGSCQYCWPRVLVAIQRTTHYENVTCDAPWLNLSWAWAYWRILYQHGLVRAPYCQGAGRIHGGTAATWRWRRA